MKHDKNYYSPSFLVSNDCGVRHGILLNEWYLAKCKPVNYKHRAYTNKKPQSNRNVDLIECVAWGVIWPTAIYEL